MAELALLFPGCGTLVKSFKLTYATDSFTLNAEVLSVEVQQEEGKRRPWYDEPGVIEHRFYGVFEGGGAKGVAYAGALQAVQAKKCWFKAVAGASAGAITAALIASGMSPEDVERATEGALGSLQTGAWAGVRRLTAKSGFFPGENLKDWLDDILRNQIEQLTGTRPGSQVTFGMLFDVTNIELNVVAADISLKRQMIFSHIETPKCSVAEAVVASSSVPFAFPSSLLQVPVEGKEGSFLHHTLVDGGVWSNFPLFVFEDESFREAYGRQPASIPAGEILAFVLQESEERPPARGEQITIVEIGDKSCLAAEWSARAQPVGIVGNGLRKGFLDCCRVVFLEPLAFLGRVSNWNGSTERGRWPRPRARWQQNLVDCITGFSGGVRSPLFGALACLMVGIGAWTVGRFVVTDWLTTLFIRDWSDPFTYLALLIVTTLSVVALALCVLTPLAMLVMVATNYVLHVASRRILYGLVSTFVAGPGAPEWIARRSNVIALPIPPEVSTLSFKLDSDVRERLVRGAREATIRKLEEAVLPRLQVSAKSAVTLR